MKLRIWKVREGGSSQEEAQTQARKIQYSSLRISLFINIYLVINICLVISNSKICKCDADPIQKQRQQQQLPLTSPAASMKCRYWMRLRAQSKPRRYSSGDSKMSVNGLRNRPFTKWAFALPNGQVTSGGQKRKRVKNIEWFCMKNDMKSNWYDLWFWFLPYNN